MFRLSAQDNDLYFFRGRNDVQRCPKCGALLKKWDEDLSVVPIARTPTRDATYSYDGVLVLTQRFKDAVEDAAVSGMVFRPLQRGLFAGRPATAVAFDAERRGTKFEDKCPVCEQWESVTGATPVYLKDGAVVPARAFVRTDLEFGSGDEKTPLILCGDEAHRELLGRKLRGIDWMPVVVDPSKGNVAKRR